MRIGGFDLGIRWNEPRLENEIRAIFAAHVVDDDPDIPPNISFKLAKPDSKVRGKTAVMVANHTMAITASDERALRAGVQLLDSEIRLGRGEPLVQAVPLVTEKGLVLLDAHLRHRLRKLEPRLARAGIQVVDTYGVLLDAATGEARVPTPSFEIDDSVLAAVGESCRSDRAGGAIPAEPMPPVRWVMFRQGYLADLGSRAHTLVSTVPILQGRNGAVNADLLTALWQRLQSDEVRWVGGTIDDAGLLSAICDDDWTAEER